MKKGLSDLVVTNYCFYAQVLSPAFGGMTAFIKETEPLLERGQGQVIRPDERKYTLLAQLRSLLLVIYLAMIIYVFNFMKLTTSKLT